MEVKKVKKLISEVMTNRKDGISVSVWQPKENDMDRIVIKFPRQFTKFVSLTHIQPILKKHGFHVAQVMGFMEDSKLWILLIRDRRKRNEGKKI